MKESVALQAARSMLEHIQILHSPLSHDTIREEKACKTCRQIKRWEKSLTPARRKS